MIKVNKLDRVTLNLSQEYDNDANGIQFDVSEWVEKYGEGSVSLIHKRTGDTEPYIVLLDYEDGVATWTISDVDTAKDGIRGTAQLIYQVAGSGVVAHSPVARTVVLESNYDVSSTPDPYDNWIAELTALAGTTTANAASASASASSASASANTASAKATEASTSATSASASASSASASATSAETAKTEANQSKAAAKVSEDNAKASEELIEAYAERAESAATSASASATAAAASKDQASGLVNGFDTKVAGAIQNIDNKKTESVNAVDAKKAEGVSAVQAVIDTIPEDYTEALEDISELKNDLVDKAEVVDLAIANRKIKALTDIVNGQLMSIDTESYTSAKVDVISGAVGDSVLKVGGRSLVVNQLFDYVGEYTQNGITMKGYGNGRVTFSGTATAQVIITFDPPKNSIANHIYLAISTNFDGTNTANSGLLSCDNRSDVIHFKSGRIAKQTKDTTRWYVAFTSGTTVDIDETIQLFDLTAMGLESITSLDQFKQIFTADYYPYNAGTILSSQTDKVTVVGKNLWDEEWEVGRITWTGANDNEQRDRIRSKNYIEVDGNTEYYCLGARVQLFYYNANKQFISYHSNSILNTYVITPNNCKYIRFFVYASDYGTTYKNDIAFVKGTSGSYSPYSFREITTNLPILKSAGNVRDEIDFTTVRSSTVDGFSLVDVIRRIGSVDLGSLNWDIYKGVFYTNIDNKANGTTGIARLVSSMYSPTTNGSDMACDNMCMYEYIHSVNSKRIVIRNDSYAYPSTFKTAMNGVTLLYEKATPTTETLEIPNGLLEAINVESGGQISFVDHTDGIAMPISTTHEWVVRNSEV